MKLPNLCQRHGCTLGMDAAIPALPPRQGLSKRGRGGLKKSRETLVPMLHLIHAERQACSLAAGAGIHRDGAEPGGCNAQGSENAARDVFSFFSPFCFFFFFM